VRAAHSEAVARCVSGVPRFSGRSAVASASVNGLELGLDRATTEVVRLIDSQSIDPSDIDIAQVLPPGADLSAFKAVVQPILDALPNITVPVALARVKVTPNERIETGTKLTQRALHATISIAGRRLADVIVGEAAVGVGDVSCGGVADLALQCTLRRLVLIDVFEQAGRVKLLGAADRRYVGRRVRIRSRATGRTVARPKVSRDGTFRATAPLPGAAGAHEPRALRGDDRQAAVDAAQAPAADARDRDGGPPRQGDDRRPRWCARWRRRSRRSSCAGVSRAATGRSSSASSRARMAASACALRAPKDGEAAVYRIARA
jgi:hypothetical protein